MKVGLIGRIGELIIQKIGFLSVRRVLAIPENSNIISIQDLEGKRIVTKLVNFTKNFF